MVPVSVMWGTVWKRFRTWDCERVLSEAAARVLPRKGDVSVRFVGCVEACVCRLLLTVRVPQRACLGWHTILVASFA